VTTAARDDGAALVLRSLELAVPLVNGSGGFDVSAPREEWRGDADAARHLGAYVTKSVTRLPRAGNPEPRVALWGGQRPGEGYGLVNSAGIPNPGAEHALEAWRPQLQALGVPIVLSLSGTALELAEMVGLVEAAGVPWVRGYELNLSCPNLRSGALVGADPVAAGACVAAARSRTERALLAKLTPACGDLAGVARACVAAGADALVAINTMPVRAVDGSGSDLLGSRTGGLSGAPLHPIALRCVEEVAGAVDVPVVGLGGVASLAGARRMLDAGARVVGVATAAMVEPSLLRELATELRDAPVAG
jgi:dihydroorotate dehydrogenase (NAD+) catalytic subunit